MVLPLTAVVPATVRLRLPATPDTDPPKVTPLAVNVVSAPNVTAAL